MGPICNCSQIVRREPGEGTGDEYCQTADGRWWRDIEPGEHRGTGDVWGVKRDGRVCWDDG